MLLLFMILVLLSFSYSFLNNNVNRISNIKSTKLYGIFDSIGGGIDVSGLKVSFI